uniref:Uncharacterized protein n=1 Tax=Arundo donax TaxID=35708 RepID=A0A0A9BD13_ARUDO
MVRQSKCRTSAKDSRCTSLFVNQKSHFWRPVCGFPFEPCNLLFCSIYHFFNFS